MDGKQIVYLRSGMTARVYQAKSQMWCDICGRSIDAGAYFSRHRLSASGMVQVACERCRPFTIIDLPVEADVLPIGPGGVPLSDGA
jgi:hypothetical protein